MTGRMSPRSTPLPESFVVRPLVSDGSFGSVGICGRISLKGLVASDRSMPWAARRLTKGLAGRAGIRVNSVELSRALGLGGGVGNYRTRIRSADAHQDERSNRSTATWRSAH